MTFDLTQVAVALIGLVSLILSTIVAPYIRAKTTREQRENILFWAKLAVQAAEKIYAEAGMGAKKKEFVEHYLAEHGILLDGAQLDVVIESAVLQMQSDLAE